MPDEINNYQLTEEIDGYIKISLSNSSIKLILDEEKLVNKIMEVLNSNIVNHNYTTVTVDENDVKNAVHNLSDITNNFTDNNCNYKLMNKNDVDLLETLISKNKFDNLNLVNVCQDNLPNSSNATTGGLYYLDGNLYLRTSDSWKMISTEELL